VRITLENMTWLLLPERQASLQNVDIKETMEKETLITCDRVSFDATEKRLLLLGNVRIRQADKDVRCERILYDDVAQKVTLSGDVQILKDGQDTLYASVVEIDLEQESYHARGK